MGSVAWWVLHVDLDQFIAAVEVLRHPELRGRPVVVGGDGDPAKRGVVSTASYEAREHGVHSGLPLRTAAKRLPDAVFLPVDREAYEEVSETVMAVLRSSGAVVEVLGWDEAFVGVETADPEEFARSLAARVRAATELDCTVGIGENKLQAKIATGFGKPAGVYRLTFSTWFSVLGGRPVDALWGIGAKTAKKLGGLGIFTVAELAAADPDALAAEFGPMTGPWLVLLASGRGDREVDASPYVAKGHGREETFQRNIPDWTVVETEVARIAGLLAADLVAEPRPALRVVVKVRYAPFVTETHGVTLATPSSDAAVIAAAAAQALERFTGRRPVRLLGVRAQFEPGARLGPRQSPAAVWRTRTMSLAAEVGGQPALRGHPDHDLVRVRVGGDEGVAARGAQVAAGQFEPLGVGGVLDHGRPFHRDVLVGRLLVLGAQAEPAGRLDGAGLAGAAAGAHVHRAARPVGVPDRDGQRAPAVAGGHAEHPHVHAGQEFLAVGPAHARRHVSSSLSAFSDVTQSKRRALG